jgi:secreted trypsin-like serine protease
MQGSVAPRSCALVAVALAVGWLAQPIAVSAQEVPSAPPPKRLTIKPKIVGGQPAQPGEFSFQVALVWSDALEGQELDSLRCGGTLVAEGWVLTAGHCVRELDDATCRARDLDAGELDVYLGSILLPAGSQPSTAKRGERRSIERIEVHPGYEPRCDNPARFDNDIALLKLVPLAQRNYPTVAVAGPAEHARLAAAGRSLTVIGWGVTETGQTSSRLRKVDVPVQPQGECVGNYRRHNDGRPVQQRNEVTGNMFCAGRDAGGTDSCSGDSGGFIGTRRADGSWLQLGVVSWGAGCAERGLFGVYTKAATYAAWMREVEHEFQ